MDSLINQFSTANLKTINLCRMYLHISLLSDITEANGHDIRDDIKNNSHHVKAYINGPISHIPLKEHGEYGKKPSNILKNTY